MGVIRLPIALLACLLLGLAAALPTGAATPEPRVAAGVTLAGVPVAGLSRAELLERIDARIARPLARRLTVRVADKRVSVLPRDAGVAVKPDLLAARALASRPNTAIPVVPTLRASAAPDLVQRTADAAWHAPVNSRVIYRIRYLRATRSRPGRKLVQRGRLQARIVAALLSPTGTRELRAMTGEVRPEINARRLRQITGAIVTVSRSERRARLFSHFKLVRKYRVAVGQGGYPTPRGLFAVKLKQVNPSWSVPNSGWAGELAGQTIPGGDSRNPIVSRWIGFTGAVGFHGTNDLSSLGSSASHGCIRMAPWAVRHLYRRVRIGTPVFVR